MEVFNSSIVIYDLLEQSVTPIFGGFFKEVTDGTAKCADLRTKITDQMKKDGLNDEDIDARFTFTNSVVKIKVKTPELMVNAPNRAPVEPEPEPEPEEEPEQASLFDETKHHSIMIFGGYKTALYPIMKAMSEIHCDKDTLANKVLEHPRNVVGALMGALTREIKNFTGKQTLNYREELDKDFYYEELAKTMIVYEAFTAAAANSGWDPEFRTSHDVFQKHFNLCSYEFPVRTVQSIIDEAIKCKENLMGNDYILK